MTSIPTASRTSHPNRRRWLCGAAMLLALVGFASARWFSATRGPSMPLSPPQVDALLGEFARKGSQYFVDEMAPSGLVRDRTPASKAPAAEDPRYDLASIATTGLALAVLATYAGDTLEEQLCRERCLRVLTFLGQVQTRTGFWHHWFSLASKRPKDDSEVSSIDSSLCLVGAFAAAARFGGAVDTAVTRIAEKMDWMSLVTPGGLSHGWRPDGTRLPSDWGLPSEGVLAYLFALSSAHRAPPVELWHRLPWQRSSFGGFTWEGEAGTPLFTIQEPCQFYPMHLIRDGRRRDYWQNAVNATLAARAAAATRPDLYPCGVWAPNAGDMPDGTYQALCFALPRDLAGGTVNLMSGLLSSLPFAKNETRAVVAALASSHRELFTGRYGLANSWNPSVGWVAPDVIGLDLAQALLALRHDKLQTLLAASPHIQRSLAACSRTRRDQKARETQSQGNP